MRLMLSVFAIAIWSSGTVVIAQSNSPISLHPENPHYFLWRGKPTVIVTSGEHYGALLNREFNYKVYFETLAKHGLNNTRTFSGTYREVVASFGITNNTLAPRDGMFLCPWARSDQPGAGDGGPKFDLTRWDDAYFARLKDFMAEASRHGIVVELDLFCPMYNQGMWDVCPMNAKNNVNGTGNCPREEALTLKHAELTEIQVAVTRKLVTELREFDNLYFEVCNEPYAHTLVPMDFQHRIIDAIRDVETDPARRHLISLNIANHRAKISDPHPAVSIFNFHYAVPPDVVEMNYGLNKVIGDNETGFRGKDDVLYRTEGWAFLLAGGGLYDSLDYSFTVDHPDGTFRDYRSPGGGSPELRAQLGVLKRFLEGFDLLRLKPDKSVVQSVAANLHHEVLADSGKAYAIYLYARTITAPNKKQTAPPPAKTDTVLTLRLPPGSYAVDWIDPKSGRVVANQSLTATSEVVSLTSPMFEEDLALKVLRQ